MPWGAAVAAVGAVASAGVGAAGSMSAAGTSAKAAGQATLQQQAQWLYNSQLQSPFINTGYQANNLLQGQIAPYSTYQSPYYTQSAANVPMLPGLPTPPTAPNLPSAPASLTLPSGPPQMTQAELEQTPGYQFTLEQGEKAVQNSAAARGLGVSGAALKGAADYATGLADQTYQTQFNIAQQRYQDQVNSALAGFGTQQTNWQDTLSSALADFSNRQQVFSDQLNNAQQQFANQQARSTDYLNIGQVDSAQVQANYNRLMNAVQLGQNTAVQQGYQGNQSAQNIGNSLIAGGQASAAGTMGAANALSGGINNAANSFQNYWMLSRLMDANNANNNPGIYTAPASYVGSSGLHVGGT